MPPQRKSKPRRPEHAALAQAIQLFIAEDEHMTQASVAEKSGLSVKQINVMVQGQGSPTFTNLLTLCEGLHVHSGTFMERVDALWDNRGRR
jgi:transcriptional regulator with XRE-family HTH domain